MTYALKNFGVFNSKTSTSSRSSGGFLPAGASDFLRKRCYELLGASLLAIAGLFLVSLMSYSPGDPSFNSASDAKIQNLVGHTGAYVADFCLQIIGAASYFLPLILATWGGLLCFKTPITRVFLRLFVIFLTLVCLAIAFASIEKPASWELVTGLGGIIGHSLFQGLLNSLSSLTAYPKALIVPFFGLCATPALLWFFGMSLRQWLTLYGTMRSTLVQTTKSFKFAHKKLRMIGTGTVDRMREKPIRDLTRETAPAEDINVRVSIGKPGNISNSAPETDDEQEEYASSNDKEAFRTGLVAEKSPTPKPSVKAKSEQQIGFDLGHNDIYELPPLHLLEDVKPSIVSDDLNREGLEKNALALAGVLADFGIKGEIVKVRPGPVVTLYELEPAPGIKTSRVIGLSDDIARSMSAISVRIAVVPGRSVIGIEMPNMNREMVHLRELVGSDNFEKSSAKLPLALGKDISGSPVTVDLARMPHLLIAGTTGSGKSVAMNTMILSLLYSRSPDECKMIMIDPKMLELSVYEGIPHLLTPVVTDPGKAVVALKWTVREMEDRYRVMSQLGVRNIAGYNSRLAEAQKKGEILTRRVQTGFDEDGKPLMEDQPIGTEPLPFIVVVVDEMADLMLVAGKDVEAAIQRLAQMARAAGIHLIMATQRPSVDVITGTIKANFPTRISFQVTSKIDSRTILGEQGAEQLLGQGDMLYMAGGGRISRVHGPFVSDDDVEEIVNHLKNQRAPDYIEEVTTEDQAEFSAPGESSGSPEEKLYDEAVALIAREGKASTSFIQRHLQIGYNRAARIIEKMEKEGVVSPANRVGRREVLIGDH